MAVESNTAVLALTAGGASLALRLAGKLKAAVYLPERLSKAFNNERYVIYFDNWQEAAVEAFRKHRGLIFIMAAGIVVRTLAPLLQSKHCDPAVVVIDEAGKFAVSLLGGHRGGANDLARRAAELCGATPVITTATDVRGKMAVDVLGEKLGCTVYPPGRVKFFNRLLAEEEKVSLYSQWPLPEELTRGMQVQKWDDAADWGKSPSVIVTNRELKPEGENYILLIPLNLVVGVGCRRGVNYQDITGAIIEALSRYKFSVKAIKALASIDIKRNEQGLIKAAEELGVPLHFVTREEINNLDGKYAESDKVRKRIGVGGVCEPAAIQVSRGKLVIPKQVMGQVTVAAAEQPFMW